MTALATSPHTIVSEFVAEATTELMAGAMGVVHGFSGLDVEPGRLLHPSEFVATTQHV